MLKEYSNLVFNVRDASWDEVVLKHELVEDVYKVGFPKVVVDIGGHIGGTAILCASRGAKVYAYEPSKENFESLVENAKRNKVKINAFNLGVGKGNNRELFHHEDNFGCFSFDRNNTTKMLNDSEIVKTITIKEVFKHIDHCDFLKIDCEGAEEEFYKDIPFEKVDRISIEIHKKDSKIEEFLRKFYKVTRNNDVIICC